MSQTSHPSDWRARLPCHANAPLPQLTSALVDISNTFGVPPWDVADQFLATYPCRADFDIFRDITYCKKLGRKRENRREPCALLDALAKNDSDGVIMDTAFLRHNWHIKRFDDADKVQATLASIKANALVFSDITLKLRSLHVQSLLSERLRKVRGSPPWADPVELSQYFAQAKALVTAAETYDKATLTLCCPPKLFERSTTSPEYVRDAYQSAARALVELGASAISIQKDQYCQSPEFVLRTLNAGLEIATFGMRLQVQLLIVARTAAFVDPRNDVHVERDGIRQALSKLALLHSVTLDNVGAAKYATLASYFVTGENSLQNDILYLRMQGLLMGPELPRDKERRKNPTVPNMREAIIRHSHASETREFFCRFDAENQTGNGTPWPYNVMRHVLGRTSAVSPAEINSALCAAIRFGYLWLVTQYISEEANSHVLKVVAPHAPRVDTSLDMNAARGAGQSPRPLLAPELVCQCTFSLLLDAVAETQQRCAVFLDPRHSSFAREAVRRVWNQHHQSISAADTLYVHHVVVGFGHQGLVAADQLVPGAATTRYKRFDETLADKSYIVDLLEGEFKEIAAVHREDIPSLGIGDDDTIFVSLCRISDRLISVVAKHAVGRELVVRQFGLGEDCSKGISDMMSRSTMRLQDPDEPQPCIPGSICELVGNVLALVSEVANSLPVARIVLHAEPLLRAIPWQWLILKAKRFGTGIQPIVWIGSGVQRASRISQAVEASQGPERQVMLELDDEICDQLSTAMRYLAAPTYGRMLSVLAHGELRNGQVRMTCQDVDTKLKDERNKKHNLVVLHSCFGLASKENPLGEMGGLVGSIFSHGVQTIIASPMPIPASIDHSPVLALERELAGKDVTNMPDVESSYRKAIGTNPLVALYAFMSDHYSPRIASKSNGL